MDADDFRDYMLSFLFLRYLSDNLNISRYISTAVGEEDIDLAVTNQTLVDIEKDIQNALEKHNAFLKELGVPPLPGVKAQNQK